DAIDLALHGVEHLDGVRGRLLDDAEAGGRLAVGAEPALLLARRDLDLGDLAETHEVAVLALREHEVAEVFRGLVAAADSHLEVAVLRLQPARGQLDVLALQGLLDVRDGEIARRQRDAVDPHAHRRAAGAEDVDLRYAGNR